MSGDRRKSGWQTENEVHFMYRRVVDINKTPAANTTSLTITDLISGQSCDLHDQSVLSDYQNSRRLPRTGSAFILLCDAHI